MMIRSSINPISLSLLLFLISIIPTSVGLQPIPVRNGVPPTLYARQVQNNIDLAKRELENVFRSSKVTARLGHNSPTTTNFLVRVEQNDNLDAMTQLQKESSTSENPTIKVRGILEGRQANGCDPGLLPCTTRLGRCCEYDCCPSTPYCYTLEYPVCCPTGGACKSGQDCCDDGCMPSGSVCCHGTDKHCSSGRICCPGGGCALPGGTCCGSTACDIDEQCCGGECIPNTATCCGSTPCTSNEKCCDGQWCIPKTATCCGSGHYCEDGKTCCAGDHTCCGKGYTCMEPTPEDKISSHLYWADITVRDRLF